MPSGFGLTPQPPLRPLVGVANTFKGGCLFNLIGLLIIPSVVQAPYRVRGEKLIITKSWIKLILEPSI